MSALDIRSASLAELEGLMREIGEPSYRASQVFSWIHKRYANSFAEMTDLSLNLRQRLGERGRFSPVEMAGRSASKADDATKYLFALENNTIIESVFMRHGHGATVCVSTQAGCRMGCKFCASASEGLQRNLSAGEMCAQVYGAARDAGERRVSNVVLMGCGEPLDNYGASLRFIHLLCDARGFGLSQRSVTLSTCGLVPRIYALAEERLPITLAVSLHAPNDELRRTLMPVANKYRIGEILAACNHYANETGRRITYEYALIDGVNDSPAHAGELAALLRGTLSHVNLIPMNETSIIYRQSRRAGEFARALSGGGVNATVRRSLGRDIDAACGQLRRRYIANQPWT